MEYAQLPDYEMGSAHLDNFLADHLGTNIDDGSTALSGIQSQLWTPRNNEGNSLDFVEQDGRHLGNSLVELYGQRNSPHLDTIGNVMAGGYVIASLTPEVSMPAIVSVSQDASYDQLKLFIWRQPWRGSGLTEDQAEILAAAAQLEAPGVGEHTGNARKTAGEAQHLLTMLGISGNHHKLSQWRQGAHINHSAAFKAKGTLPSVSGALLSEQYQTSSLVVFENSQGRAEISIDGRPYQPAPHFRLLWHRDSMQSNTDQGIRIGDSHRALAIVQGAGFMAVRNNIDNIKRAIHGG